MKTQRMNFGRAMLVVLGAFAFTGSACARSDEEAQGEHAEAEEKKGPDGNRVTVTEAGYRTAGIQVEEVTEAAGSTDLAGLEVPGQVELDPARVAVASPRTGGRIERIAVVPGQRVRAGETVALLLSREYLTAQADLARAVRRAVTLKGTPDESSSLTLIAAAERRMKLLGVGDEEIAGLKAGGEPNDLLTVRAPLAGSVLALETIAGSAVEAGTPIARIADLSSVLVMADVPERAIGTLRAGQRTSVRLAAFPQRSLGGRVERLLDQVDPATRTVKAAIRVENLAGTLRPGMFAAVTLQGLSAESVRPLATITVPSSAIITEGEVKYVFVEVGERTYERRTVDAAPVTQATMSGSESPRLQVRSGLVKGERLVVRGAFALKSELAKASFGEHE